MQASRVTCAILTVLVWIGCAVFNLQAASLQTFALLYGQITNDLAIIESTFDGSSEQKQQFAALSSSQSIILDPEYTDEQALKSVIDLLSPISGYDLLLDVTANAARDSLLSQYASEGERVALLPPSSKEARARKSYNGLASEISALTNAQHAAAISSQLAPLGRDLADTSELVDKAVIMPRPNVGQDALKATLNNKHFKSGPSGNHSANTFSVSRQSGLYYDVECRVVDTSSVIQINLPVITDLPRYEVGSGLATLTYTPDVFAAEATTLTATNGVFWVQVVKNELYGLFSCSGPGLEIKEGKFRIRLPN